MTATKPLYVEATRRIERLHRQVLDFVHDEFKRMGWHDITPAQALLLHHIGPGRDITWTEVCETCWSGTNPGHNLKKLVSAKYLSKRQDSGDRRVVKLKLTPKGEEVAEVIDDLYDRHLKLAGQLDVEALSTINSALGRLERALRLQSGFIGESA